METIIIIVAVGTLNAVCFFLGAKVGQTVAKGETIEMPNLNPIDAYHNYQDKKEYRHKQNRTEVLLENIDTYDGTSFGQKDIPR